MRTLPELTNVSSDLLANSPQLKVTINRDQASRFGISAQLIDDTLYDAYGQRQVTQYYTQLNTSPVILEITPELQRDLSSLDRLYVKSPVTGGVVPLTALVDIDSTKTGPLTVTREACLLRFRPILMTTAAAMLAGVPLALGSGPGSELRQPLGYAMVGGLALSQLLTLYTTPVVYLYLGRLQAWLTRNNRDDDEPKEIQAIAAE